MNFTRNTPIVVVAGSFVGKKWTFIELTGSHSARVKLKRDTQAERTLRMTSIRPEGYETDEDEETVTLGKQDYIDLMNDLDELEQHLKEVKHRLNMAVAKKSCNRKKK